MPMREIHEIQEKLYEEEKNLTTGNRAVEIFLLTILLINSILLLGGSRWKAKFLISLKAMV